ncbi:PAS domain-containing hybrid sensor histidine kinase/response regulator [Simiduia agarivorans]|uniref:histidine kinase n=1 Tax=Simiduia agarivorans (strain DSM 21679 / JCM 13881 / BCRC 17597 / SA1) TaxID=1117647 RepID=K4KW87_SIMAS|nr:PAS domain-containing hybrid sensor histidine kinase/response regulator [Simiduia agarivorans]AFU98162.1 two-component hybrid sensor and regulator [Simiduia agarivorans SA1 = DSM 21679]
MTDQPPSAEQDSRYRYLSMTEAQLASADADALRERAARYQRIFYGSGCGFWEWDLELNQLHWEGSFWAELGYDNEVRTQIRTGHDLFGFVHPEDVDLIKGAVERHVVQGEPYYVVYRIRHLSGDYRWTEARGNSRREADGKIRYLSGVNIDITNLKQAEARLRESEARHERILRASNDGIWEWNREDKSLDFTDRCWEMIGVERPSEGERNELQVWFDYMHPEDLPRFKEMLASHVQGKVPFDIEYRMLGGDNQVHWIKGRGSVVLGDDGEVISMAGSNLDITLLKEAEQRVLQARDAAENANRAKSEFLSSMSHELRTPLNAIMGFAQLFDYDDNLTSEQLENLREIRKAGGHLLQLINDVLDLAKIESGKLTLSLEPVLPSRIVRECIQLVQSLADGRAIKISTDFRRLANAFILADSVRFKQVMLNLLSNAIKYNRMGGSVEVIFSGDGQSGLRIGVRDTGHGIPENKRKEMYQPFNRLGAEGGKVEGSGVGLVITRRLMEMMHGSIDFESRVGTGTTFWLTFEQVEQPDIEPEPHTHAPVARAELNISVPHKVLYIEDNPSNIRVIRQFCQRFPLLELEVAEEAFMGLYKARTFEPDIVILDINLPGMDGYEVLEVLKADAGTADIPVLALSANAMNFDVERGRKAGFFEYLTKPIDINRLIQTLNRLVK